MSSWDSKGNPVCIAHCSGPFRLVLKDGTEITPGSSVRKAFLAVLILSSNQARGRKTLQNMFWGAADGKHASGSMRTVLFQLKRDLKMLGDDVIRATSDHVSLVPGAFEKKILGHENIELLEGLDLSIEGSEVFEEWLREVRLSYVGDDHSPEEKLESAPNSGLVDYENISLGLLPVVRQGGDEKYQQVADSFLDNVIKVVIQTTFINVFDLRGTGISRYGIKEEVSAGCTLLLYSHLTVEDGDTYVSLSIREARSNKIFWVFDPINLCSDDRDTSVAHIYEILLNHVRSCALEPLPPSLLPWATLSDLFSLDYSTIVQTEKRLQQIVEEGGHPVVQCLHHFAQIFKQHEGLDSKASLDIHSLRNALEKVPVHDPLRSLCESMIGYCAHMLLSENEFGKLLLESAHARTPALALNLDHLSILRLSEGNIEGAENAFASCMQHSALCSWRYSYDVTGSIIAMAKGDFKTSLLHANRALLAKPRFVGALRYAMIGFALVNNERDAFRMKTGLLHLRPEYDLQNWLQNFLRRSDPKFGDNVAITLQSYGLVLVFNGDETCSKTVSKS